MNNDHIEQIEALVEAGDKVSVLTHIRTKTLDANIVEDDAHIAMGRLLGQQQWVSDECMDFYCQAANSRAALKELLSERERLREALEKIAIYSSGSTVQSRLVAKQALKPKGDV